MRTSRKAWIGFLLVIGLTGGTIAGAQASVGAKGSVKKFCEKALEITNTTPESYDDAALIELARDFVKEYKKLAKAAPNGELRKAAKTISKYYDRLADTGDPNSEEANYTDKEVDAVSTITAFNVENCAAAGVVPST